MSLGTYAVERDGTMWLGYAPATGSAPCIASRDPYVVCAALLMGGARTDDLVGRLTHETGHPYDYVVLRMSEAFADLRSQVEALRHIHAL